MKVKYLFLSIMVAFFFSSAISMDKTLTVGKNAPKIETIEGVNVGHDEKAETKNKLISFWNPKKPFSRISNKNLSRHYSDNSDDTIEFISICTDSDEMLMNNIINIDGLDAKKNYSYSQISPRVFKDYGVEENPRAFLISPEGKILEIM